MASGDTQEEETDDTKSIAPPKALPELKLPTALVPGEKVGRFVVVSEIGQGGMGAVYAAFDPDLNRKVAVKLLHAKAAKKGSEATIRLQREAQALARISHPNVVSVHDVGMHAGGVFIAMEFIEGVTLRDWAKDKPRAQIVEAFCQAAEGLAAIHAVGLVHRDFKASNVVVSQDGRVRVLDLGLARLSGDIDANSLSTGNNGSESEDSHDSTGSGSGSLDNPLTRVGDVTGTTGYIAPELFTGATATPTSDQFSFGVALFKALFNEMPFKSRTLEAYAGSVRKGPPSAPPENSKVPHWLFTVICRTLETAPEKRFGSMDELLRALRNDPTQARRRKLVYALATLAFAGVVFGVYQATNPPCLTATQSLESLWPVEKIHQLESKLSTRRPTLIPVVRRGLVILDQRIREWAQVREEVCLQDHPRFAMAATSRRFACLSRKEQEFKVLLDTLNQTDELIASKSAELIRMSATDPSCQSGLDRREPDDVGEEHQALARELRGELLKSTALRLIARFTDSRNSALEVAQRAHQANLVGFEGEALYRAGLAEYELAENDNAVRHYRDALFLLMSGGVDHFALQCIDELVFFAAQKNSGAEGLRNYQQLAESLFGRMGSPRALELALLNVQVRIAKAEGKSEDRIARAHRATEVASQAFGHYSVENAQAWSMLGSAFWASARLEESLHASEESMKILEVVLGKNDPKMVWRYQDVADGFAALGRDDEAIPLLERAYGLALRVLEPDSMDLADVAVSLGDALCRSKPERALHLLNGAVAQYEKKQAPEGLIYTLRARARALVRVNRGAEALADCERVERLYHEIKSLDPNQDLWISRCKGNAFLTLRRYKEAETELTKANKLQNSVKIPLGSRARLLFELSRAKEVRGAPAEEVRKLCEEGLHLIAGFPPVSEVKQDLLSCVESATP